MKIELKKYASDPAAFRNDLIVDVDGQPKRFGEVQDDWQRADFAALDGSLKLAAGRSSESAKSRMYCERPRGASKTTDLAVTCCWALAFASRPLKCFAFAADRDQADLLKQAMEGIVRLNPWLASILNVQRNLVLNVAGGHPGVGSRLEIFASDVGSSYGILPDIVIADELTHWQGDGSLWHSIISSCAKRSTCLLVVISNAGFQDSWQWSVREAARTDESWIFSRLEGPPSWMLPRLDEMRRHLPRVAFARLFENQWSTGGGDALLPEDIEAAFNPKLEPMTGTRQEREQFHFVAGVDLGLTRDCSAIAVLAIPRGGRAGKIQLAAHRVWKPILGRKIDIREVEYQILEWNNQFAFDSVALDTWQSEMLSARLSSDLDGRCRVESVNPTGANLRDQATLTIEYFQDRRFEFYPCEPLKRDLLKLRVEEKSYGVRLTSPRDGDGHGDLFSSLALAILTSHRLALDRPFIVRSLFSSSPGGEPSFQWKLNQLRRSHEYEMRILSEPEPSPMEELGRQIRWERGL